jgi:hypothetical protein
MTQIIDLRDNIDLTDEDKDKMGVDDQVMLITQDNIEFYNTIAEATEATEATEARDSIVENN